MHLHTKNTAKLYMNTVTLTDVWRLYFQVYSSATWQSNNSVCPPWGAAVCVTGVAQNDTAHAGRACNSAGTVSEQFDYMQKV